jgi:MFS transporter, DHA2 family, methylenomycin A resistance protein
MAPAPLALPRAGDRPRPDLMSLLAISLGFFLIQLDATIVNVALPSMQHDVGGSVGALQWIVDAYTLALSSVMLTAGAAADRLGPRQVFLAGLLIFAGGSAAAAAAPQLGVLIGARAVQGLGGAALLPSSLALLSRGYPSPGERARALGVWGAVGSLGMAVGPLAGGTLVSVAGWRSIFALNVPVCAGSRSWSIRR